MIFVTVFAVPALAGLVALGYGVVWLTLPASRAGVARRYPLRTLTWLMAGPGGLAALAAVLLGVTFGFAGSSSTGGQGESAAIGDLLERASMPAVGLLGTGIAISVIVIAHRIVSLRRRSRPWLMLILAALPILVLVVGIPAVGSELLGGLAGYVLALGATANALMAVPRASATRLVPDPDGSGPPSPYLPPAATPPPPPPGWAPTSK